jgi:hypothetical protein
LKAILLKLLIKAQRRLKVTLKRKELKRTSLFAAPAKKENEMEAETRSITKALQKKRDTRMAVSPTKKSQR